MTNEEESLLDRWFTVHEAYRKACRDRIAASLEEARLHGLELSLLNRLQELGRKHNIVLTKAFSSFVNKEPEKR